MPALSGTFRAQHNPASAGGARAHRRPGFTRPDRYYFAHCGGLRNCNKSSPITGGGSPGSALYFANTIYLQTPSFPIINPVLIWARFYMEESNSATSEKAIPADAWIEAARIKWGSTTLAASAIDNSGLLAASSSDACIFTRHTGLLPADTVIDISVALRLSAAGQGLIANRSQNTNTGELGRYHASSSFAAAINGGASVSTVSGSTSGTIGGYLYAPIGIAGMGLDGRDVLLEFGDSLVFGAGMNDAISAYGIKGLPDHIARRQAGQYMRPAMNLAQSSSYGQNLDPGNSASYAPSALAMRLRVVEQVRALNADGTLPFTLVCMNWWNNDEGSPYIDSLTNAAALIKAEHDYIRGLYPGVPHVRIGPMPKAGTQTGYLTAEEQSVLTVAQYAPGYANNSTGVRFALRDAMIATRCGGAFEYFLDPIPYLAWDQGANRDKWANGGKQGVIVAADSGSGATFIANTRFDLGEAVFIPDATNGTAGRTRTVSSVTDNGDGTYTHVTVQSDGTLSGSYPSRTAGRAVIRVLPGDGNPVGAVSGRGVHPSQYACQLAAPMGDAFKARRAAEAGAVWT